MVGKKSVADLNNWLNCSFGLLILFKRLLRKFVVSCCRFLGRWRYFLCPLSAGSSTACIVILDRQSHQLHTANLGDSGFLVVRGGEVVHRSDEQQHYFNTPFQLSIAPPGAEGAVLSDRYHVCLNACLQAGQRGCFRCRDQTVCLQITCSHKKGVKNIFAMLA